MAELNAKRAIKRTNDIIKAMADLDSFRRRIEAVQDALEKDKFSIDETCYEICNIGVAIQKVSTMVRPHTVEGQEKLKQRNLKAKFRRQVNKNKRNVTWVYLNCRLPRLGEWSRYDGGAFCDLAKFYMPTRWRLDNIPEWGYYVIPTKKWLEENDNT